MELLYQDHESFEELLNIKKNFVFIGEAGSGKSEIALNTAKILSGRTGTSVDLFDLDQTKPLFRSRDLHDAFSKLDINIHYQDQFLDAPVMVSGIRASLISDRYTLLDIGGGYRAAKYAASYADLLSDKSSIPVYVINPYRPWTKSPKAIDATMKHILSSINLKHIYMLANPNLGFATTVEDFMKGLDLIDRLMNSNNKVNSACIRKELYDEAKNLTDIMLVPIDLFLSFKWAEK